MRIQIHHCWTGRSFAAFSLFGLLPLLTFTSCKTQNPATAAVPAANSASYPDSNTLFPTQSSGGNSYPNNPSNNAITAAGYTPAPGVMPAPKPKAPPAPKFKPFSLADGETLVKHTVQKGDTLSSLSRKYGTSVSRIQSANALTSTKILAGKSYKIPTRKSSAQLSSSSPRPTAPQVPTTARTTTTIASSPPNSFTPPTSTTYTPPVLNRPVPSNSRPTFEPRDIQYNGPSINSAPSNFGVNTPSGASITIPPSQSGGGSSFDSGF